MAREDLRNIAIIAHVDHGKTTLVDRLFQQSGLFRDNLLPGNQIMDQNELERERGITIVAKNASVTYGSVRINLVDTPGHADFGGEVERALNMVDGVLLLVDATDGPMPQTRFVLQKALAMQLKVVVVLNKMDKDTARPEQVVDLILELFMDLDATEAQLDFPVVYASTRFGLASTDHRALLETLKEPDTVQADMTPLLALICAVIPPPSGSDQGPFQMLVSNIDYDPYLGRLAVGRIQRGCVRESQSLLVCDHRGQAGKMVKSTALFRYEGLARQTIEAACAGEIICLAGLADSTIGQTLCDPEHIDPLPFTPIDEPTLSMLFQVNDSPFAGREGTYVTSRHLRDRLFREMDQNVALQVETTASTEAFVVKGRGELHLSILIESMRREGYEFQVSKPEVIVKHEDGRRLEPVEEVVIDLPEAFTGLVIEKLGQRGGELQGMEQVTRGWNRLTVHMPSRGLIGYRSAFLTDTKGNGIMNSVLIGYQPWKGTLASRNHGVIVAWETGQAVTYGLHKAQERGTLMIEPGTAVYAGMVVGSHAKIGDLLINVCRRKQMTNIRAAGSDDALRLTPPVQLSLEQMLEFVADDELIEITPKAIRLRKRILNAHERMRQQAQPLEP